MSLNRTSDFQMAFQLTNHNARRIALSNQIAEQNIDNFQTLIISEKTCAIQPSESRQNVRSQTAIYPQLLVYELIEQHSGPIYMAYNKNIQNKCLSAIILSAMTTQIKLKLKILISSSVSCCLLSQSRTVDILTPGLMIIRFYSYKYPSIPSTLMDPSIVLLRTHSFVQFSLSNCYWVGAVAVPSRCFLHSAEVSLRVKFRLTR